MKSNSLFKGSLNTIILTLLKQNDRMYGYEITQKVKEMTSSDLIITEGALYPALHKLEGDGLLTVSIEKVGNRNRKYYQLTENGKTETVNRLNDLKDFIEQMQLILNTKLATQ
ncbi:MAG: PadR family transcriptional regulator [Bacteroidetes bacterium]|nr:PadR family transcriptional regulator [Bacteroidota bacterium]MBU1372933.1 PadR family transcriptional regulator [Bacteroidota bacterium]MBU1484197.1 PadR family transcriptional regulator [Bacteroidota bacterium]MBU1761534.1 PadR family transcriptional regulator [Bacteroidota bacterium]MBU2046420.1 PadR family transcriptional regulator [Bacteroidota bacterium]